MTTQLNDCPRPQCKGQADVHGTKMTTGYYWVECIDCKAKTNYYSKRVDAENAWNNNEINF
jgi:hypothetical protein